MVFNLAAAPFSSAAMSHRDFTEVSFRLRLFYLVKNQKIVSQLHVVTPLQLK